MVYLQYHNNQHPVSSKSSLPVPTVKLGLTRQDLFLIVIITRHGLQNIVIISYQAGKLDSLKNEILVLHSNNLTLRYSTLPTWNEVRGFARKTARGRFREFVKSRQCWTLHTLMYPRSCSYGGKTTRRYKPRDRFRPISPNCRFSLRTLILLNFPDHYRI